jgi:hypothetical protein
MIAAEGANHESQTTPNHSPEFKAKVALAAVKRRTIF